MTTRKQWQARGMKRPPPKAHVDLPVETFSAWFRRRVTEAGALDRALHAAKRPAALINSLDSLRAK